MTLKDLVPGQKAVVDSIASGSIGDRLMELGCLPGESISVERVAPFGDTIAIRFSGLSLCIRKNEAMQISIKEPI